MSPPGGYLIPKAVLADVLARMEANRRRYRRWWRRLMRSVPDWAWDRMPRWYHREARRGRSGIY